MATTRILVPAIHGTPPHDRLFDDDTAHGADRTAGPGPGSGVRWLCPLGSYSRPDVDFQ